MDQPTATPADDGTPVADLVKRARQLRAVAKDKGTLTPAESAEYRAIVVKLRGDDERLQKWIARRIGVSRGRIAQLLTRPTSRTEAAA